MGASQSTGDLTQPSPASILEIRDMVSTPCKASKLSDCGLGTAAAVPAGGSTPWKWTFTTPCGTAGNLVLTRGPRIRFHQHAHGGRQFDQNDHNQRVPAVPLPVAVQPDHHGDAANRDLSGHDPDFSFVRDGKPELKE